MLKRLTLKDLALKGKRVFVRVDYNVPMDEEGNITNDERIIASLPTINHIREQGGKVILATHLGRPGGEVVERLRLAPISKRLGELLGCEVRLAPDCIGEETRETVISMGERDVVLLENLRFHKEEVASDPEFSRELAALADLYVNDAFASLHRAHASIVGVPRFLSSSAAGLLLEREIESLDRLLTSPSHPFVLLIAGAKPSTKMGVIRNLLDKIDILLAAGKMGYTLLLASGYRMGKFKADEATLEMAREILISGIQMGLPIVLPTDIIVAQSEEEGAETRKVLRSEVPQGYEGVDIGPATIEEFRRILLGAKTILWNGPVGLYEIEKFSKGTEEIAKALAASSATTVIGGGDTIAALDKFGSSLRQKMSHISTGGGATLEFLAGRELPGLDSLTQR